LCDRFKSFENQTRPTTVSADDFHPHFNHDGTQIGFISRRDRASKIYTMNVDSSSQTRKFSDSYFDAGLSWKSDGLKQVFCKDWDGSGDVNRT
jgi:Tol biopolymer transport system component